MLLWFDHVEGNRVATQIYRANMGENVVKGRAPLILAKIKNYFKECHVKSTQSLFKLRVDCFLSACGSAYLVRRCCPALILRSIAYRFDCTYMRNC